MNQHQFDAFMIRSRDLWETMETYRLAYLNDSEKSNKYAENLKWLTLISGVLTGLSSVPVFLQINMAEYYVAFLGALTGALSLAEKLFGWEQRSSETWQRHKSLENLQKELFHYALDISGNTDAEASGLFIQQISVKSEDETRLRITDLEGWKNLANEALRKHRISQISFADALPGGPAPVPAPPPAPDEFMVEDTPDIVAVARGGV